MKKVLFFSLLLTGLLIYSCQTDSNPADGGGDESFNAITRTWTNYANQNHSFSFITFDSTAARGVFWGNEDHPQRGSHDLCGFFDRSYVEFDLKINDGRIKYTGNFITSDSIVLNSNEGKLVITR